MAVVECAVPRSFLRNSPTFAHIETFAVMSAKQALANGRLVRSICHLKSMDKAQARLGNVPNTNSLRIFSFLLLLLALALLRSNVHDLRHERLKEAKLVLEDLVLCLERQNLVSKAERVPPECVVGHF